MTNMPTVYHFDAATGELLSSSVARPDPRAGRPRIPAHATADVPPEAPAEGHALIYDPTAGTWREVEDHRGETVYATEDGREVKIHALGPLPDDTTTEPRPSGLHHWDAQAGAWVADLEDLRAAKLQALADHRWQVETGGMEWNGVTIPTSDRDKALIKAAADRARRGDGAPSAGWKVGPGVYLDPSEQDIEALHDAVEAFVDACFARERALAEAIVTAEDEAALEALDIESGWPN